jgi:hypothetical protein
MASYTGKFGTYYAKNAALTKSEQEVNAKYIYASMTSRGWSLTSICGILGNAQQESTINPGRWQNNNTQEKGGYGLVQWTNGSKYINWEKLQPEKYIEPSMDGQLARFDYELENNVQYFKTKDYPITFKEFKVSNESAEYLAKAFGANYERSGAILAGGSAAQKSLDARGNSAKNWYNYLVGQEVVQKGDVENVVINSKYGYWVDSGKIDTMPKNKCVWLFNKDKEDPNKMGHIGAYDASKNTEIQAGGYGGIVTINGVRHSTVHEQTFNKAHWSNWAALPDSVDWSVILKFMRAQLGELYKLGAAGEDEWDCSGIAQKAMREVGYDWYHGATTIYKRGFEGVVQEYETTPNPTLREGAYGEDVKKLQSLLNDFGANLEVDGKFGKLTAMAVRDYQKKNGLKVDSIVGKNTWTSLLSSVPVVEQVILFTVTIPNLDAATSDALVSQYPNATVKQQ